ncbi:MAG TPA: HAD family phosphatase [Candidatus Saccharimonadales bacterium]
MARSFAVFDIDGTIIRWQLYHALADELARRGHLDPIQFQKVRESRMNWKKRTDSFTAYEQTLVNLIRVAIIGISVDDLRQACKSVLAEYRDQVYTYTRDLIKELQAKDYLLFAISASQSEIVGMLADYYGFDDYGGSTYETRNGYFTGKNEVLLSERKPIYLKELIKKHGAVQAGSIAVGDSQSDIPMLSAVEQPTAFNPTRELFEHARQAGWPIVIERKNMVYRLEPRDGTYRLVS